MKIKSKLSYSFLPPPPPPSAPSHPSHPQYTSKHIMKNVAKRKEQAQYNKTKQNQKEKENNY